MSRQLAECRELAARNAWEIQETYIDNDVSASGRKARPEWTRLLADLEAGRYDVLVCWHTDRLYRRLRDLVDLVELAESQALRIATVRAADLDLSTPAGRMLAGMLGSAQRYEMEQKAARQVAANKQARNAGRMPWSVRPYGYDLDENGSIVVVPAEADELREAARLALDGASLASIARGMNERGVVTATGGRWSVNALKRLLTSNRHAGLVSYRGSVLADVGASWEPIYDKRTHALLAATLTDPARRTQADTRTKYLLSGIARCGKCGGTLYASPANDARTGRRYYVYRCHTPHLTRRLDLVDEVVVGTLLARLSLPDMLEALSPTGADTEGLVAELARVRDRLDGLAELYGEGEITAAGLREAAAKLRARQAELHARLAATDGDARILDLLSAENMQERWDGMPLRHRRSVVDLLATVTVLPSKRGARFDPDQVRIEWKS